MKLEGSFWRCFQLCFFLIVFSDNGNVASHNARKNGGIIVGERVAKVASTARLQVRPSLFTALPNPTPVLSEKTSRLSSERILGSPKQATLLKGRAVQKPKQANNSSAQGKLKPGNVFVYIYIYIYIYQKKVCMCTQMHIDG